MADIYLRAQNVILADIKRLMRDELSDRWTEAEMYGAVSDSLERWGTRVGVPHIYTISGGFVSTDYDYVLPTYVRGPLTVQHRLDVPRWLYLQVQDATVFTWVDVPGWELEPDDADGTTLRLITAPMDLEARVIWTMRNGPVPSTIPSLTAEILAAATSATVNAVLNVADSGYVKIEGEWIFYAGLTRGATTTTLLNLERGLHGTTAATHAISSSVYWGVAVPRQDLFEQMYLQIRAILHELYLTDAAPRERDVHERLLSFYQDRADKYWRKYTTGRVAKMVLTRQGTGDI